MDIKDVENLASLARIKLPEDEKKDLLHDMDNILGYMEQIGNSAQRKGNVGTGTSNIWREDEVISRDFSKELITEQFPDKQDGFLKVKKIL